MGEVVRLHAAGACCNSAKRSKVTLGTLLAFARSTTAAHLPGGMYPRARQLLTTGASTPMPLATAVVPPSSSMILPADMAAYTSRRVKIVKPHELDGDFCAAAWTIHPMANTAAEIGARLEAMHAALSVSQADVCRATGISENRYSQYVNGKRPLTLDAALKIVGAYGVTLDWLFLGNPAALPAHIHKQLARVAA